jgi:hypothetical protein
MFSYFFCCVRKKKNLNPLILFWQEGLTTWEKIGKFGVNFRRLRKCVDPTFFENIVYDEKKNFFSFGESKVHTVMCLKVVTNEKGEAVGEVVTIIY